MGWSAEFRVREYECDLYGHLNNANYLRWMQAVDEQNPIGDRPIRTVVEYLTPLEPGRTARVEATAERRDRGYRLHSYRFIADGAEVARGTAEWLAVGGSDLGQEMPQAPPPPPGKFVVAKSVEWRDVGIDAAVNIASLAALAEDAGIRVAAAHGWSMTRCAAEGFAIVLRKMSAAYTSLAGLDDEIGIETWVSDPRRSMATRHYEIRRVSDHGLIARFRALYVWVDIDTNRPIRIPEGFLTDFSANFVS